jgi:hypothetical protein
MVNRFPGYLQGTGIFTFAERLALKRGLRVPVTQAARAAYENGLHADVL